jgi:hypothetical protein
MRMNPWLLGGGAVALVLLVGSKAQAALMPGFSTREADLDALATMLITETSFAHTKAEMAQIVNVAINRSRKWGVPISKVVAGPSPAAGRNAWNGSANYKALFARAPSNPRWPEARAFVAEVLDGGYPNIGAKAFIHPGGMPTPPCVSTAKAPRVQSSTLAGERCIPPWAVGGRVVGKGMFA